MRQTVTSAVVVHDGSASESAADLFRRLPPAPHRALLESQGGPDDVTRYSFIAGDPFLRVESRGREVVVTEDGGVRRLHGDPFEVVDGLLDRFRASPAAELPLAAGGAVGYVGYDLGRLIERLPDRAADDLRLPEMLLGFYDHLAVLDHRAGRLVMVAVPFPGRERRALEAASRLRAMLRGPARLAAEPGGAGGPVRSNVTRPAYLAAVERVIEYIRAGDIFQANLAQRFTASLRVSPWTLYERLRAHAPAPFAAFLDCGRFQIASASPERFLHVERRDGRRRVETRPIKGTRPRGATPEQDRALADALWASEKDRAELVMIVDLERNDLGRVCEFGTVRVPSLRRIEAYPTVFHTVATVEGVLRPEVTPGALLRATFPGGSVTGAPKVRAMEIIEELEPVRRGVYCGAIGYLGFDGRLDLNIAIRTAVCAEGQVHFHAGGGIVADSDPAAEYEETLAKASGFLRALGAAPIEAAAR